MAERNRLSDRLKRIRAAEIAAPRPGAVPNPGGPPRPAGLPEEWHPIGPFAYRREILAAPGYPGKPPGAESLLCKGLTGTSLVFFDTETTGLSGGAGTHIFLFGTARVEEDGLKLVQILLTDFPGEAEFLSAAREELHAGAVLVSYNGKGFDSHLLNTRCIMNGIRPEHYEQVDLLYVVRRFWGKILPACNLSTVEERLLGVERGEDIPGYAVPARYFEFLKAPDYRLISPVIEHNAQDVISLALLYSRIDSLLENPDPDSADPCGLGRFLIERGRPAGERLLEDQAARGHPEALKYVSLAWKRRGDYPSALSLWESAWRDKGCLFSALELAKYLEHKAGDYLAALAVVREMEPLIDASTLPGRNLVKRRLRLEAKISRRGIGGGS